LHQICCRPFYAGANNFRAITRFAGLNRNHSLAHLNLR
jgi:hypothetical protein